MMWGRAIIWWLATKRSFDVRSTPFWAECISHIFSFTDLFVSIEKRQLLEQILILIWSATPTFHSLFNHIPDRNPLALEFTNTKNHQSTICWNGRLYFDSLFSWLVLRCCFNTPLHILYPANVCVHERIFTLCFFQGTFLVNVLFIAVSLHLSRIVMNLTSWAYHYDDRNFMHVCRKLSFCSIFCKSTFL